MTETAREILRYERGLPRDLWTSLDSESKARDLLWQLRLGSHGFGCRKGFSPKCLLDPTPGVEAIGFWLYP